MGGSDSPADQLAAAQRGAEELLQQVAASGRPADSHVVSQLDELSIVSARLAFRNELPLTENVRNLISWCDHLDDAEWRAGFVRALQRYALEDPFDGEWRRP
jgi:hypothetical protein